MDDGGRRLVQEERLPQEWRKSAYERWLESEGIPVVTDAAVPDLREVAVASWPRTEARGAFIRLLGTEDTNNAYVLEIPPGGRTAPEQHLYEEFFFVVDGRGGCEVWNQAAARQSFEWQAGSLFSIPFQLLPPPAHGSGRSPSALRPSSEMWRSARTDRRA